MNVVKKMLKFMFLPWLRLLKNRNYRLITLYSMFYKYLKVKHNVVFYESYHGKNMTDNPYAIFKQLITTRKDLVHVWAVNDKENYYAQKYRENKKVKFVRVGSIGYIKYLAISKYLINNVTFPPYFQKKDNQVYINTWHGTPLKTLGKDMRGKRGQLKNIQRNFLQSDYILSPNNFTTTVLINSHDINGIFTGVVLEEGYPRIDATINSKSSETAYLFNQIEMDQKDKIILYAPTWRGEVGQSANRNDEIYEHILKMNKNIPGGYRLILKVHTLMFKFIKNDSRFESIKLIPDWVDTNELLSIVDILITDYSSIFFDYMVTKKPILYFMYDVDDYTEARGLYLDVNNLPGPVYSSIEDITSSINRIEEVKKQYQEKYLEFYNKYCSLEQGNTTKKIIDAIFNENKHYNFKKFYDNYKTNILIYCGGFKNNGITTSALNLMNNIDYSKFNVVIIDKDSYDRESEENISKINVKTKVLYRVDSMNATIFEHYRHALIQYFGCSSKILNWIIPRKLYQRELLRMYGGSKFDIAIDFSGYVPFWSTLFAFGEFKVKNIYQHNDMYAEKNKLINGDYKHKKNLSLIFSFYKFYTHVVSVSKNTRELNLKNLSKYLDEERAIYVHNSINAESVLKASNCIENLSYNDSEYIIVKKETENKLSIQGILLPKNNVVKFITVGRLSPEKDQAKLIQAFSFLSGQYSNIALYIVGSGVLDSKLKRLVASLGLQDRIIFTGHIDNPHALMKLFDCFILSSNHEGQPMVLLEALVLSKHIISTDIAGSRSVIENAEGTLVSNSVEGLYQGMKEFIEESKKEVNFDYKKYNDRAMAMFYDSLN
ncbi:glycosyltransferase [Paenibacillus sp. BIC5C1]|uniref:glycosyltransferase n=1 Tax=Paenibacillus sp. BIC5C1 TaxID=3078263 RepID=UPI0028EF4B9F|nr:glycosyltransferase [Paenibacillus sp. BIC5C1]